MIYSDLYLKKSNKLAIITGFFIVALIGVVFFNSYLKLATQSKAAIQVAQRVDVVNLSPQEATVFWKTDQAETGWVAYGNISGGENNIVLDEKDNIDQAKGKYKIHVARLINLTPGKKYFFKMISDNNHIIVKPDGSSFSFITPQTSSQNTSVLYGVILQPNSSPLINADVIVSVVNKDFYPFFAETKNDGSWLISINQLSTIDGLNNLTLSRKEQLMIEIITPDGNETKDTLFVTNPQQTQTLPTLIFGQDRNYPDNNVLSASTSSSANANTGDLIQITYPIEGSLIPGTIPLIKGVGLPNTLMQITVNSKQTYSAVAISDSSGNWSYLLPASLELGPHTVTLKTKDKNGQIVTIVRSFTMIAQEGNEGRVLGTATSEPTLTLTDTPAPTYPVATLTPASFSGMTATPGLLKSGNNFAGSVYGGLGLIIIGGGVLLVF